MAGPHVPSQTQTQIVPDTFLTTTPPNPYPRDHTELFKQPYFHNLVVYRWIAARDVVTSQEELLGRLEEIVALIEREQG